MEKFVVDIKNLYIYSIKVVREKQNSITIKIDGGEIIWSKRHKYRYVFDTEQEAKEYLTSYIHDRKIAYEQAIEFLDKKLNEILSE